MVAGGCTSSYEALTQGTPVVTFPSDALRGRFTFAMLKRLGLDHFIAPSLSELSVMAVEVLEHQFLCGHCTSVVWGEYTTVLCLILWQHHAQIGTTLPKS